MGQLSGTYYLILAQTLFTQCNVTGLRGAQFSVNLHQLKD
jgi:hypothetical protein